MHLPEPGRSIVNPVLSQSKNWSIQQKKHIHQLKVILTDNVLIISTSTYNYLRKNHNSYEQIYLINSLKTPITGLEDLKTQSSIKESQRRFQNILTENLGLEVHSAIYLALLQESIHTLSDLETLSEKDIKKLEYIITSEVDDGQITTTTSKVSKGNRGKIKALIAFIKYYHMQSKEEFESVTLGEFNTFRLNEYNPDINPRGIQTSGQNQLSKRKKNNNTSALSDFKKNFTRDKNQYTTLREDSQWDSWNCSTKAIASTHDCEYVFNEIYLPVDGEHKELFLEKKLFIFYVQRKNAN